MVYLVGAGPGDPGLITVKALELIKNADVILFDRLADPGLLLEAKPGCVMVDVGKESGSHTKTQDETTNLLVEYGRKGLDVVRLKGGDPFLFGRGGEEAEKLVEEKISFEIVPGVSALSAVPAYAGIPLTHRSLASSVGVATGHGARGKSFDPVRWGELGKASDTIVVFMGIESISAVTEKIIAGGMDKNTPAAIIEKGTTHLQRTVSGLLSDIAVIAAEENVSPPALLVIGKTVELGKKLSWFVKKELSGLRIVVTRPFSQARGFSDKLKAYGAGVVLAPAIKTVNQTDTPEIKKAIGIIEKYNLIIFSSANGVHSFFQALKINGRDTRSLAGAAVAVIGPATSDALSGYGVIADIKAERYIAEGLFASINEKIELKNKKILLTGSDIGRKTLEDGLRSCGADTDKVVFYKTEPDMISDYARSFILKGDADIITFTSSSTVNSFFGQIAPAEIPGNSKFASIGPETSATIGKFGIKPHIEATEYTTDGLLHAILDYCGNLNTKK